MSDQHENSEKRTVGASVTRRRIAQAGLAAPVVLTLANRRALGQTQTPFNCTPSGWMQLQTSINPSGPTPEPCMGYSPGYWKTNPTEWVGYSPGETKFRPPEFKMQDWGAGGTLVSAAMGGGGLGSDLSMMQALWKLPGTYTFHLVAGLLNANKVSDYIPIATIQKMYCELAVSGQYEVTPGVYMSIGDVIMFMKYTYHVFGADGT